MERSTIGHLDLHPVRAHVPAMPSSVIADSHYDRDNAALTVRFTTGRVYRYRDVPPAVAEAFGLALSKGRFFNLRIRDHYRFDKLTPGSR